MASCVFDSPIGKLYIEEIDGKLTYLGTEAINIDNNETTILKETKKQLLEYFNGKRDTFNLPISLNGTEYQIKVWNELIKIPYGKTYSYQKIAELSGNIKGSRSVGMACSKNNIMIVVPCHRVISKSKKLTGFAGGLDLKEKLLLLEKNNDWIK